MREYAIIKNRTLYADPDISEMSEAELLVEFTDTMDSLAAAEKQLVGMSVLNENIIAMRESIDEHGMTPAMESLVGEALAEYQHTIEEYGLDDEYSIESSIIVGAMALSTVLLAAKILFVIRGIIHEIGRFHSKFGAIESIFVDKFDKAMVELRANIKKPVWKQGSFSLEYTSVASGETASMVKLTDKQVSMMHRELASETWKVRKNAETDKFISLVDRKSVV